MGLKPKFKKRSITIYSVLNTLSFIISLLSVKALENLTKFLTFLFFDLFPIRRSLLISNISQAFPNMSEKEKISLARKSAYHSALTFLEFLHHRNGKLGEHFTIKNRIYLDTALSKGNGAYILCIHMSSWEAMGAIMSKEIAPSHVIVKKVGSDSSNRFVEELRAKNGFLSILRRKKGDVYRKIRTALSKNEIVGFVIDQARPGEPELPFFGSPAKTNTSFAAIWQRCPSPIIPAFIIRKEPFKYELKIFPELILDKIENNKDGVIKNSMIFNKVVESMIKECPEQYFWYHDRWKARKKKSSQ